MSGDFSGSLPSPPAAGINCDRPVLGGLPVSGITPFTTIDFPGLLAAVLYTQGCAWQCAYCFNTELQSFKNIRPDDIAPVVRFIESRRGLLDGIVFSGGEPTVHPGLIPAMRYVRGLGYKAGLHTTGMYPARLKEALSVCDWAGMDIKAPFDNYEKITRAKTASGEVIKKSAFRIIASGVDYEFRTTYHPALLTESDLFEMACELRDLGAEHYAVQYFKPHPGVPPETAALGPGGPLSPKLAAALQRMFKTFQIRD